MFSHQEFYFIQWSFGIRFSFSNWSNLLAAFWLFSFWSNDVFEQIVFFRAVPFLDSPTVPSWKARTDCSSSLCCFWWNRNVLWCFLGKKWSFIAKRGTNCSKLRICSERNCYLMDDYSVRKNLAELRIWEVLSLKEKMETCFYKSYRPLVLKGNQLFRVPNSERNNLVLYVRFGIYYS